MLAPIDAFGAWAFEYGDEVMAVQERHGGCAEQTGRRRHRPSSTARVDTVPSTPTPAPPPSTAGAGGTAPLTVSQLVALNPRSRSELLTTNTEENAIAAPAIIGLSRPAAASGRAATL